MGTKYTLPMLLANPSISPRHARADQPLPGDIGQSLARGRIHEICGPSGTAITLMTLGLSQGPILWIAPSWLPERPYSCGMRDHLDPGRVIFVRCRRIEDVQWSAEEALRAGAVTNVVIERPDPPPLTPVRRLQLAAETGAEAARRDQRPAPLGLLLIAGEGGAQGVESRWHSSPLPSPSGLLDSEGIALHLERRRARAAPPQGWHLLRRPDGTVTAKPAPV